MAPPYELITLQDYYDYYIINCTDPRVEHYPLLGGHPWPTVVILLLYLWFVYQGPSFMAKKQPMNLKSFLLIYNFGLILLSGFMFYEFLVVSFRSGYSYLCQPIDYSYPTDDLSLRMARANFLFFFSKIIELADTVIFILRKKNNQVTFLHVWHHTGMVINWWMAAKYCTIGQCFFVGMVNSFIHTIMYTYYGLAGLGPHMQKYLWWKKYMTRLQLIQFVLIITHTGYNKFIATDCSYPWPFNTITFYYTLSIFVLFLNFYYQTYIKRRSKSESTPVTNGNKAKNGLHIETTNGIHPYISNGVKRRQPLNGNSTH